MNSLAWLRDPLLNLLGSYLQHSPANRNHKTIQVPRVLALVPLAHLSWGSTLNHLLVSRDGLGAPGMCWEPRAWEKAVPIPALVLAAGQRGAKGLAGSTHCPSRGVTMGFQLIFQSGMLTNPGLNGIRGEMQRLL